MINKEEEKKNLLEFINDVSLDNPNYEFDESYEIKDNKTANLILGSIKELREQRSEIEEECANMKLEYEARIEAYKNNRLNSINNMESILSAQLQQYADNELAKQPKKKSIRLLNGTLGYRKSPVSLVYGDTEPILKQLLSNKKLKEDCVRTKQEIDKSSIRKIYTTDDDNNILIHDIKIDGIKALVSPDVFYVK